MSSIEKSLAPRISSRRFEISGIDAKLHELNLMFPDDGKMPGPEYLAQRSEILTRRQFLSKMQRQDRRELRRVNR